MKKSEIKKLITAITIASCVNFVGCSNVSTVSTEDNSGVTEDNGSEVEDLQQSQVEEETDTEAVLAVKTYENDEDGAHAIEADGESAEYIDAIVSKTGDSEGDEADFYGENSAIFATNGAHLTLTDMEITTDGTHANAVFSYGEGTVVDITHCSIYTYGNCSGGIMTTGDGTMNAKDLTIHTSGRSSAAIRSDRGGGTVTVEGGSYTTEGTGSPAIYSTADITVNNAELTSTASQGVVVEGNNSVTLNNVTLNANNNQHNSDKSDYYEAVMIYQSMSGDADSGLSKFSATDGSIINENGDIFFVNNTATDITLSNVEIVNNGDGVFLRAAAAGWGSEGSNGGKVNLTASKQQIDGDIVVDDISLLNFYMKDSSTYTGSVNKDGAAGDVYVELTEGSKWVLSGDSYIKALTCDADSIDLNGHTLYVDGKAYTEGEAVTGEAIEIKVSEGSESRGGGDGKQAPSEGDKEMQQPSQEGNNQPPEKPEGDMKHGDGNPPEKPDKE